MPCVELVRWMNKTTYEQELEKNGFLIYTTQGRSMRPFLRSQEDLVRIEACGGRALNKYDAVLYRRKSGRYVLHRIVRVLPDSYVMCGDNCWKLEYGITREQILGVLTCVIRKGEKVDVNSRGYRTKVWLWGAVYWPRALVFYFRDRFGELWALIKKKIKRG